MEKGSLPAAGKWGCPSFKTASVRALKTLTETEVSLNPARAWVSVNFFVLN